MDVAIRTMSRGYETSGHGRTRPQTTRSAFPGARGAPRFAAPRRAARHPPAPAPQRKACSGRTNRALWALAGAVPPPGARCSDGQSEAAGPQTRCDGSTPDLPSHAAVDRCGGRSAAHHRERSRPRARARAVLSGTRLWAPATPRRGASPRAPRVLRSSSATVSRRARDGRARRRRHTVLTRRNTRCRPWGRMSTSRDTHHEMRQRLTRRCLARLLLAQPACSARAVQHGSRTMHLCDRAAACVDAAMSLTPRPTDGAREPATAAKDRAVVRHHTGDQNVE